MLSEESAAGSLQRSKPKSGQAPYSFGVQDRPSAVNSVTAFRRLTAKNALHDAAPWL
jgi:hypothetical protein